MYQAFPSNQINTHRHIMSAPVLHMIKFDKGRNPKKSLHYQWELCFLDYTHFVVSNQGSLLLIESPDPTLYST